MLKQPPQPQSLIQMLLSRLERIPADSPWAHRASGIRGSLLRSLERTEHGQPVDPGEFGQVLDEAFEVLGRAAETLRRDPRGTRRSSRAAAP